MDRTSGYEPENVGPIPAGPAKCLHNTAWSVCLVANEKTSVQIRLEAPYKLFEQKLALVSIVGCHPTSFHETVEWWVFRAREGISRKMPGCPIIGSGKSPHFGNPASFQLAVAVHVVALSRKQCMLDRFHALKVGVRALKWAIAISMLALISVSRRQQLRGVVYVCKADVVLYRMLQHIPDSCRKSRNNHLILSKTLTAKNWSVSTVWACSLIGKAPNW